MGLQSFISNNILISEEKRVLEIKKYGKDVCPNCLTHKNKWFRTLPFDTLECMCGRKFYGE